MAQYLSLHNPDATNPNEPVNLANGAVQVQATITDGDGDTASSNVLNIGAEIGFRDDAPTAPALTLTPGALVAHDETGGIQNVAGVSTDIAGFDTGDVQRHGGHVDCQYLLDGGQPGQRSGRIA